MEGNKDEKKSTNEKQRRRGQDLQDNITLRTDVQDNITKYKSNKTKLHTNSPEKVIFRAEHRS